MASSVGGFITLRALHRPGKRRRASAHSRRASLLHPSCPLNDLPRTNPPNMQTCRDTPTGSTRSRSIITTDSATRISRGARIFMRHIVQRFHPTSTPSTDKGVVTPLASARAAQTRPQGQRERGIGLHGDPRGSRASATLRAGARELTCRPSRPRSRAWGPSP